MKLWKEHYNHNPKNTRPYLLLLSPVSLVPLAGSVKPHIWCKARAKRDAAQCDGIFSYGRGRGRERDPRCESPELFSLSSFFRFDIFEIFWVVLILKNVLVLAPLPLILRPEWWQTVLHNQLAVMVIMSWFDSVK